MRHLRALAIIATAAALSGGPLPVPGGPAAPSAPSAPREIEAQPTASTCWDWRRRELAFAKKHNAARTRSGVAKMRLDPHLGRVARKHTYEMLRNNRLFHTSTSALSNRVTNWTILGENVGVGGDVDSLFKAFMNSPSHKANILYGKFRYFGVGTKKKGDKLWVTIVFEAATDPGTTLRMPRC